MADSENLKGQPMQQTLFQEHELYYQHELVWWEGRFQPIVSTWVYLGKHVLSGNHVPDDATGHVFAYWDFEPDLRWHASSVMQTFWTLEAARHRMCSWEAFSKFILTRSQSPCQSHTARPPVGMDSLIAHSLEAAGCVPYGGGLYETARFVEKELYYSSGFGDFDSAICQTDLCEERVEYPQGTQAEYSWRCSTVFSRNLGLERVGMPVIECGPMTGLLPWNEWCAYMLHFVEGDAGESEGDSPIY